MRGRLGTGETAVTRVEEASARSRGPSDWASIERDAIVSRLGSILELVERNLARVDRYLPYWRRLDEAHPNRLGRLEDKVASEHSLLLLLVSRVPDEFRSGLEGMMGRISAHVQPFVRNERFKIEILRNPERAAIFGLGHLYLTHAGYGDSEWDEIVIPPLRNGFADARDLAPNRILERVWARELAGLEFDSARAQEAARLSIVAGRAHPILMSLDDAYAYTHCLMYSTDFGRRRLDLFFDQDGVSEVVSASLAWTLVEPDFDLLAEFLLCETFMERAPSEQAAVAWRTLLEVWDRLGFVPGPTFDETSFLELEGDDRRAYAFKEMYHANIVVAAVCASLLGGPLRPPLATRRERTVGSSAGDAREAELLTTALARCRRVRGLADEQTAPWELVLGEEDLRIATGRTLLEAATIHAVRMGNPAEAREAVADLAESGFAGRTLAEASDQLLRLEQLNNPAYEGDVVGRAE